MNNKWTSFSASLFFLHENVSFLDSHCSIKMVIRLICAIFHSFINIIHQLFSLSIRATILNECDTKSHWIIYKWLNKYPVSCVLCAVVAHHYFIYIYTYICNLIHSYLHFVDWSSTSQFNALILIIVFFSYFNKTQIDITV